MPCSAKFSITLQTEILSTENLVFFKQIIFLKSFHLVLCRENAALYNKTTLFYLVIGNTSWSPCELLKQNKKFGLIF